MENQDIRWKQRFASFEKALKRLTEIVDSDTAKLSDLEKEGLFHRFEFTHELCCKVIRDFLIYEGFYNIIDLKSIIREAFNKGIICSGTIWMEMIESRNLALFPDSLKNIRLQHIKISTQYYPLFVAFKEKMKSLT